MWAFQPLIDLMGVDHPLQDLTHLYLEEGTLTVAALAFAFDLPKLKRPV
jgi:hypothetical protein